MAYDVVVVGGGLAGLVAARDLGAEGRSVVVLEARRRLGGRVWRRPFAGTGPEIELGGAWFDAATQHPIRQEAERYGIEIGPATEHEAVRWFTGGELRSGLPVPRGEGGDLERVIVAIANAAAGLAGATADELRRHDVAASEWLDRLTPPRATRDFVYAWTTLMSGADPAEHPMLAMLSLMAEKGDAYSFYSDLANVFPAGTAALVDAVAADVRGEIRLEAPALAIRQTDAGVAVETAAGALEGSLCVLAVPVNVLGRIALEPPFDARRRAALEQGQLCRAQKIWMLASGVPERMLAAGWSTPFYWLSAERAVGEAQLVVAFALHGAVDAAGLGALELALQVYVPEARVLAADYHDWTADPWSRGGWMTEPAGWASEGVLDLLAQPQGRVLVAGSDVAPVHAGWMAGAIASGRRAAKEATARLAPVTVL